MAIEMVCECGKHLSVPEQFAGRKATCKACGAKLLIPLPSVAAPVTAPAAAAHRAGPSQPATPHVAAAAIPAQAPDKAFVDETLYDASPSMFRNYPIRFLFGLLLLGLSVLISVFAPKVPTDPVWPSLIPPGAIILIYAIWWLKCLNSRLTITRRKIVFRQGILTKSLNEVRLNDVRNVLVRQGLVQRLFGVGAVGISTSGQSGIEIEVKGIPHPSRVREIIDRYRE